MVEYIQHITKEGERWCDVASTCYGNAALMNIIIEDNPDVPLYDILPANTILNIRVLPRIEVNTDLQKLPPWKQ